MHYHRRDRIQRRLFALAASVCALSPAHVAAPPPPPPESCAAGLRLPLRSSSPAAPSVDPVSGYHSYVLVNSTRIADDTKLLSFALLPGQRTMGATLPSCMKVRQALPHPTAGSGEVVLLDKSYSPVSYPDEDGTFTLLVKAYPPRPPSHPHKHGHPGGLGAHLTNMRLGETTEMRVKPRREFHGLPYAANRWRFLGLVAGGTGIAPMVQMIRTILSDPLDNTKISLVFANRRERDILLRKELDAYAEQRGAQFRVRYVLSQPPDGWVAAGRGSSGWVSAEDVREPHLPRPGDDTMVMVCGRDEFLKTVSGNVVRGPPPPGKKKGPKLQGPLTGLLKAAGYTETMVYKF